jgi:tousled-like kinase
VACKLHGLNAQWSEEKKQSYIRHAIREYNIHKTLVHPNIVRLWDIFEIDQNTFCTVLEYCSGKIFLSVQYLFLYLLGLFCLAGTV